MSAPAIILARPPSAAQLLPRVLLARRDGRAPWPHGLRGTLVVPPTHPDWLAAYRRVTGFDDASPLPATLPQVRAVPLHMAMLVHPTFPLAPMGIVHVRQRLEVLAPLRPESDLLLTAALSAPWAARRGCLFDLNTSASTGGVEVWRGSTTILSRTRHPDAGDLAPDDAEQQGAPEPVEEGSPLRSACWRLEEDLGRRYTHVAGDFNPIHLYRWSAKLFGFRRAIIHGMWTLARSLAELGSELPDAGYRCEITFERPIFLPSSVLFASSRLGSSLRFEVLDPASRRRHVQGRIDLAGG